MWVLTVSLSAMPKAELQVQGSYEHVTKEGRYMGPLWSHRLSVSHDGGRHFCEAEAREDCTRNRDGPRQVGMT